MRMCVGSAALFAAVGCVVPSPTELRSAAAAGGEADETPIAVGVNAAVSPDGRSVACQRFFRGRSDLLVRDLATGAETWVEKGGLSAIHPAWAPDGTLVYSYCSTAATAHEKWIRPKTDWSKGWILRAWKDGVKTDLTSTEARDFLPTVTADGKRLYFTTTRGAHGTQTLFSSMSQHLAVCDFAPGGEVTTFLPPPNSVNAGQGQCAVSPDGAYIVWAQIDSFWDSWCLLGARIDSPKASVSLLPDDMVGLSPRWHPDSRTLAFAGYREGDDGWSVYLTDVRSGDIRRICTGDNPSFTPDGKSVVYDRGGTVYRRTLAPADFPSREAKPAPDGFGGERVLWRADGPGRDTRQPLPPSLAFSDDATFFVRVKAHWSDSKATLQHFVSLAYGDTGKPDQALQVYRDPQGYVSFATRDGGDQFTYLQVLAEKLEKSGDYEITCVKSGDRCYLSVNGGAPVQMRFSHGVMSFRKPRDAWFARGFGTTDSRVGSVEVGTGWPATVPRPGTRKGVFE